MHIHKQNGIAFLVSIIFHVVLLVILTIFFNKQKAERVSSFVELDLMTVENPKPKRRFRRTSEVIPLYDVVDVDDISKELEFRPKLATAKVNVQFAMPEYSPPSTAVRGLQEINGVSLSRPVSASASRIGKRFMNEKSILPRPAPARSASLVRSERKNSDGMDNALLLIAEHIANMNQTGQEDLVFLIDASGSMEKYIMEVANYLTWMANVLLETGIDYTFGILTFNRVDRKNQITIYKQTKDLAQCELLLRAVKCYGDEKALDAIAEGLSEVKFRPGANRTFVLVTNEKLTGKYSIEEIIQQSKESSTKVNVIGVDNLNHRKLAEETGGLWFQAPQYR